MVSSPWGLPRTKSDGSISRSSILSELSPSLRAFVLLMRSSRAVVSCAGKLSGRIGGLRVVMLASSQRVGLRGTSMLRSLTPKGLPLGSLATSLGTEAALKPMAPELSANEALVKVVWTERGLITFGFGASGVSVTLTESNIDELVKTTRELSLALRSPGEENWRMHTLKLSNAALGPAALQLRGAQRITLITDGPLSAIPTNILSMPGDRYRSLIETAGVKVMPSLGYRHRSQKRRRKAWKLNGSNAFVLAKSNYGQRKGGSTHSLAMQNFSRAADGLGLFVPLPETEKEVEIVQKAFGRQVVTSVVGKQASESSLNSANLSQFRFLHFATHGILGGQIPDLHEPALVLAVLVTYWPIDSLATVSFTAA